MNNWGCGDQGWKIKCFKHCFHQGTRVSPFSGGHTTPVTGQQARATSRDVAVRGALGRLLPNILNIALPSTGRRVCSCEVVHALPPTQGPSREGGTGGCHLRVCLDSFLKFFLQKTLPTPQEDVNMIPKFVATLSTVK